MKKKLLKCILLLIILSFWITLSYHNSVYAIDWDYHKWIDQTFREQRDDDDPDEFTLALALFWTFFDMQEIPEKCRLANPADPDCDYYYSEMSIYTQEWRASTPENNFLTIEDTCLYGWNIFTITGHTLDLHDLWDMCSIAILDTDYVVVQWAFNELHSGFPKAIISKRPWWTVLFSNDDWAVLKMYGAHYVVIDNVIIDWWYDNPNTPKSENVPWIKAEILHWHYPPAWVRNWNISNATFNNVTIRNCSWAMNIRVAENVLFNNITTYNNTPSYYDYQNDEAVIHIWGYNYSFNNIKSFDNIGPNQYYIQTHNIRQNQNNNVSINNAYINRWINNCDISIKNSNVILNNIQWNICGTPLYCYLNNIVWNISSDYDSCYQYWYYKHFGNSSFSYGGDNWEFVTWAMWWYNHCSTWCVHRSTGESPVNLWCQTLNYIINPNTWNFTNSKYNWNASSYVWTTWCIVWSNWNTTKYYITSWLEYSYWKDIINQVPPVKFTQKISVKPPYSSPTYLYARRIELRDGNTETNQYIASDTIKLSNLSLTWMYGRSDVKITGGNQNLSWNIFSPYNINGIAQVNTNRTSIHYTPNTMGQKLLITKLNKFPIHFSQNINRTAACWDWILQSSEDCDRYAYTETWQYHRIWCNDDCTLKDVICPYNITISPSTTTPNTSITISGNLIGDAPEWWNRLVTIHFGPTRIWNGWEPITFPQTYTYSNPWTYTITWIIRNVHPGTSTNVDFSERPVAYCTWQITIIGSWITINQPYAGEWKQSKSVSATINGGNWTLEMREWNNNTCNSSLTSFVPYTSKTYTSESDSWKYICYRATYDWWTTYTYEVSEKIEKIDTTKPNCLWWDPTPDTILPWQTWKITLVCGDQWAGISTTNLNASNFVLLSNVAEINTINVWWTPNQRTFEVEYEWVSNGQTTITIQNNKISDNAGNKNNTATSATSIKVGDITPPNAPTCTPTGACFSENSQTINCHTTEPGVTIRYTAYTNNGTLPNCSSTQRTNTSFSSTTILNVIACNSAWIVSSINTYHYTKDTTWPIAPTHISPNNNATTNKLRPTLKWNPTTDSWCSSVSSYEVRVCGQQHCTSNIVATGTTWGTSRDVPQNLTDWESYYRQVRAKDSLGNRGPRSDDTKFTVKANKPTCARWTPTQQCISWWVAWTIKLTCTDASWIATTSLSNSAITYDSTLITLSNATVSNYSETYEIEDQTTTPAISAIFENKKDITTTLVSQSNAKMIAWIVSMTIHGKVYTFTYTWKANVNWSTTFTLKTDQVKNTSNISALPVTSSIWTTIDNNAPTRPTIETEPTYTQWLSNTVSSNTVSDNGCNQTVQYQFCKSETSSNTSCTNISNLSSWTTTPTATFNNLTDGWKYYYFVRSNDGLWNISNWSTSTNSTQDNTKPTITFDKNSWSAASSHTVKVTVSDTGSKLAASQTLYYRWQTGATCSMIQSQYSALSLNNSAWEGSTNINISTTSSLPNWQYYLCILNRINDRVWNKNNTTRTSWKFIKADVPPVVSATNSSPNWKSWNIQITLNVQSTTQLLYKKYSRISLANCKSSGTEFYDWQQIQKTSEWSQTLYLCAQDEYGQTWEWSGTYKLDKTKPTWSFSGISQYCIPKNTYARVSITWNDSVSWFPNRPIKWNNETNRYEFTSTKNILAGNIVTATIIDNAWNTRKLNAKVEKCPDEDNFEFYFSENNCTSWNITVTINWNHTHVTKYQRWDGTAWTTDNYKQFIENRSWQIKIELDNWTILSWPHLYLNVTNIDKEAPTVTIIDAPESVNECETWTIIFNVQDSLCWSWNITANITWNWTTINEVRNWSWEVIFTTRFADDSQNNWKINYVVTDSVWNKTIWQKIITLNNVPLTWRDFKRELIQVGNKYIASWNREELSRAKAWSCETITATKWTCNPNVTSLLTITNKRFSYTGNNKNTVICGFKLADWDTTITLQWTFKYCNNPNDCAPTLYPKFISWTYYTEYSNKKPWYNKYTSGTESSALVLIDIDWDGYSNMSWYRYSYIQGKNYCKELTDWKPCSTAFRWWAIPWFCEILSWFLEANGTTNPKTCIAEEPSWTNWLPYPNDNIFQINIADSDKWSDTIPYQSAYQWPRQIWIQVQDSSGTGRISAQVPTDVINYTTEKPYIELAEDNNRKWWWKTIYTVNDNEFTIVLNANGADLENWLTWLNYNYYNSLTNDYPILIQSGVLKFDMFNQWLLSKYRGR